MSDAKQAAHWQREREYWTSKVAEYTDKLSEAKTKRDDAIAALAPFKVGQEVEYNHYGRGAWVPALVRMIEPHTYGCYFQVSFRKKNGEWADRTVRVYSLAEIRVASDV